MSESLRLSCIILYNICNDCACLIKSDFYLLSLLISLFFFFFTTVYFCFFWVACLMDFETCHISFFYYMCCKLNRIIIRNTQFRLFSYLLLRQNPRCCHLLLWFCSPDCVVESFKSHLHGFIRTLWYDATLSQFDSWWFPAFSLTSSAWPSPFKGREVTLPPFFAGFSLPRFHVKGHGPDVTASPPLIAPLSHNYGRPIVLWVWVEVHATCLLLFRGKA